MGLDITAYTKLQVVKDAPAYSDWCDEDYARYLHFYEHTAFPGTMAGLDQGAIYQRPEYTPTTTLDFRAGSYSGYNWWRDHLCRMAHGISAEAFWKLNAEGEAPSAFRELIDFADNEGVIGPVVAAKLARDFAEYQHKTDTYEADHNTAWWRQAYSTWRKAFDMAADGGAVEFH